MMHFRSVADLSTTITNNLDRLPHGLDLIVGIPRSGLLAANLVALHLNKPMTDLEGFLAGRVLTGGERLNPNLTQKASERKTPRVLVIDDSICSGRAMDEARRRIAAVDPSAELFFAAVYATHRSEMQIDLAFERCPLPRVFEWNLMHSGQLAHSCVDIDGVLCVDPTEEQNDDGPRYAEFLENAPPLLLPTYPVHALVTCRLEKYRRATETWLAKHGVKYQKLVMLDLPNKAARIAANPHGRFKAGVYASEPTDLFIESSSSQALKIADIANKPVYSVEARRMVYPAPLRIVEVAAERASRAIKRRVHFATSGIGERLHAFGMRWRGVDV